MKKKFTVLWIDDDPSRKAESDSMKSRLKLDMDIKFIDVKNKSLPDELKKILSSDKPDLILMDHMLDKITENGYKTGSTAAEVIHEKWADCPIICVTEVDLKDIDLHKQSIYEDIFEFANISSYYSTLVSIAASFQELKKKPPQNIGDFIGLLKAPEDDLERLKAVIPEELKNKELYQDESLLLTISRWVRQTLMAKPGFLYDRLWTATLLGIKEESLPKIEHIFSEAKYSGIFADEGKGKERWWQSKLKEILFCRFPEIDEIYPWKLGRKLPGIAKDDFSKCHASGEDFPETVAYTDEAAKTREPMRLRYTVSHPGFEKSLFFEEMRMMQGEE
jgi:CheY-like chemotaxis protein